MRLIIEAGAWLKMQYYVDGVSSEISGLGKIEKRGEDLYVTDCAIFKQTVSGAHSDLDVDTLAVFLTEMTARGEDPSSWRLWWHSHANMAVFFSGTDTRTIDNSQEFGWLVSLVTNHKHELKARVDIFEPVRMYADVTAEIQSAHDETLRAACAAEISEKVARPLPTIYTTPRVEAKQGKKSRKAEKHARRVGYKTPTLPYSGALDDSIDWSRFYDNDAAVGLLDAADTLDAAIIEDYYEEKEALQVELEEARAAHDTEAAAVAKTLLWELRTKGEKLGLEN